MNRIIIIYYLIVSITIINASNQYLGCFIDQIGERDLTTFIGDYDQLTPKECILHCHKQNFPYAGIQYGNECRCGQHYGTYGQVSEDDCDHLCSTSEKCGGYKRNSVYHVDNSLNEYKTIPICQNNLVGYLGCISKVSLEIKMNSVDSLKECIQQCSGRYIYAGVSHGNLCYCGNELILPLLNSNLCNIQCSTSSDTINTDCCGGLDVFSVYHIPNYQSSLLNDQPETIVRAINDTTQTSQRSSLYTTITSTQLTILSSSYSPTITSSSTDHSSSSMYTTSIINNISSSVYSSLMMSSVTSATPISSTKILETLLTTSHLNTNTASTVVAGNTITTSFSSIVSSQLSTNYFTTMTSSIASIPSISSSFYTYTSKHTDGTTMGTLFSHPTSSVSFGSSITSMIPTITFNPTQTGPSSSLSSSISEISSLTSTIYSSRMISTIITTESPSTSPITSSYSSQITTRVPERTSSERSILNTLFSSTNTLASSSSIYVRTQTTMTSSFPSDITNQTTTASTTTTTISPSYIISTILIALSNQTLNPNDNSTQESIRQKLIQLMNFAFLCEANSSLPNCTQTRQRIKRQIGANSYGVNLVSNIAEVSTSTPRKYQTNYTVFNSYNSQLIEPVQVKSATDKLSRAQITSILGYDYDGQLIRSTSIQEPLQPVADRKLWLIGAVLGPVGFALLLIFIFCYLHYKCRPRQTNRLLTKPIQNAPLSTRATNNPPVSNEVLTQPPPAPTTEKSVHILTKHDPLVGASTSFHRLASTESEGSSNHIIQQSVATEIPMDEIRHQNDVERWRNKLRLQEQYHPSSTGHRSSTSSSTSPFQYDNRVYAHDLPTENGILSTRSSHHSAQSPAIEAGRTKLHRLLDEVLDKADSEQIYNPESESEKQKRRRQRRRIHSVSEDRTVLPVANNVPPIPHIPVIAQVSERPDPTALRLRYNPYEAGDRVHDIARTKPVELIPKYDTDDQRYTQYSSRANPPLFYDDSNMADRAATAIDAYATPKRTGHIRLETDQEAMMRHNGGNIERRQHRFNNDSVYIDSISKNRGQIRPAWVEPEVDENQFRRNDYRDEYIMAKRSVLNTKNIISSIHDELQHIVLPKSEDYQA